ncbi:MAG: metallophosphoesterase [Spirosomataceae bacterium]
MGYWRLRCRLLLLLARDYTFIPVLNQAQLTLSKRLVKNNFLNFINAQNIDLDLWLLLGDNAYDYGTEGRFTKNFFDIYGNTRIMKQTPIAPAAGNHEFYPQNGFSKEQLRENKNDDYFKVFSMDSSGLAGGYHSGNKVIIPIITTIFTL